MAAASSLRLDELLVLRGLAESRAQAKALVMAGRVRRGTERLEKPGKSFPLDLADLSVEQPPRFVSRGGEKLDAFLKQFQIPVQGAHALDIGASTGGFTDCVLQTGAVDVVCVDVGRAQLHAKLRADTRVTNLEQVNARKLKPGDLPRDSFDIIVVDVSFISLRSILPPAWSFLASGGHLIALVKPQFEAGKREVDRGRGVIKDTAVHAAVVRDIQAFSKAELISAHVIGIMESPITGADGNREFLLGLRKLEIESF